MTKGVYSIGFIKKSGGLIKIWDNHGSTRKWNTIEECEDYINTCEKKTIFRIYKGWEVIKEIDKR